MTSRAPVEVATEAPNGSSGIVRVVEGITFHLPSATTEGAEQARIMLSDLAESLGYERKAKLKELANRHAKELNEFGSIPNVGIVVTREGRGSVVIDEPAYNPEQAAYLALRSRLGAATETDRL